MVVPWVRSPPDGGIFVSTSGDGVRCGGGRAHLAGGLGKLPQGGGQALACPCGRLRLGAFLVIRDALLLPVVGAGHDAPSPRIFVEERLETQHASVEEMAAACTLFPF